MKKLNSNIWNDVITTIQAEIEDLENLLQDPYFASKKCYKERLSNLKIALKEFETQQIEDLLS